MATGRRVRQPNVASRVPIGTIAGQRSTRPYQPLPREDRERYAGEAVAAVQAVAEAPVSTFAVDVDTGSYANVRRLLNSGQHAAARRRCGPRRCSTISATIIRAPQDRRGRSASRTDMATTPWNANTRLLRVGLRGYDLPRAASGRRPTSSSWSTCRDRWTRPTSCRWCNARWLCSPTGSTRRTASSIVVYAGAAGLVLEPTSSRDAIIERARRGCRRADRPRARRASSSPIDSRAPT